MTGSIMLGLFLDWLAVAIIWYHTLHILLYTDPVLKDTAFTPKLSATLRVQKMVLTEEIGSRTCHSDH